MNEDKINPDQVFIALEFLKDDQRKEISTACTVCITSDNIILISKNTNKKLLGIESNDIDIVLVR